MKFRTPYILVGVLALGAVGAAACGDDETTGTSSSTAASTGSGMRTCDDICNELFDCGLEGTPQHCVGFVEADRTRYLNGSMMNGCVAQCPANPALAAVVNPNDCATTVATISAANAQFACTCDNGVTDPSCSSGGAGGTGGSGGGGGTGGAGGN